jgi:hypothetical protein
VLQALEEHGIYQSSLGSIKERMQKTLPADLKVPSSGTL